MIPLSKVSVVGFPQGPVVSPVTCSHPDLQHQSSIFLLWSGPSIQPESSWFFPITMAPLLTHWLLCWVGSYFKIVDGFSFPASCQVLSGSRKPRQQEESFRGSTRLISLCPMIQVYMILSNRMLLLGSDGQPRATTIFCFVYGPLWDPLDK